ncbi:MAG: carbohydrate ABC transporter permease [Nitrososphaerales archaeon]
MKRKYLITLYFVLAFILLFEIFPIYWLGLTSVRPIEELLDPQPWPKNPTARAYVTVVTLDYFQIEHFHRQLLNSIIIALATAGFSMFVSSLGGYSLARIRFPGNTIVSKAVLFTYIMPPSLLAIAFFDIMNIYGLVNTYPSVIIAMTVFTTPFGLWIMKQAIRSIPIEVEESALIDGANRVTIFFRIIIPLTAPVLVALATYSFIQAWNEYLYVLVLMSDARMFTAPVAIASLLQVDEIPWALVSAMSIVFSIPPVIFFYALQKYMVAGLTRGAVKA